MAPQAGIPEGLGAAIVNGLGLMPEGEALSRAIEAKAWLDSALRSLPEGTTLLSTLSDPLHTVFSGVTNWAMSNVKPLNEWMQHLTGDPEHVRQVAAGWREIGKRLQDDAISLGQSVIKDITGTEGVAISAYTTMQCDTAAHIAVLGGYAKAMAFLFEEASTVVQKVRSLVYKAISDVAAQAGKSAILSGCTLGLGTPIAVLQILGKVSEWSKRLSSFVDAVPRMAQSIQKASQDGAAWLKKLDSGLKKRADGDRSNSKKTSKTSGGKNKKTAPQKDNKSSKKSKSGPVVFQLPKNSKPGQLKQLKEYVDGCNRALKRGQLSPSGRVSTKGQLRTQASAFTRKERREHPEKYKGNDVGHIPDTTWTGKAVSPEVMPMDSSLNRSLGAQALKYEIGYKPTSFHYKDITGIHPPLTINEKISIDTNILNMKLFAK